MGNTEDPVRSKDEYLKPHSDCSLGCNVRRVAVLRQENK
jgi:hypothetical protein